MIVGPDIGPGVKEFPLNVNGSSTFGRYPKISIEKTYNMFESDGWLVCLGGYEKVLQLLPKGEGRGAFQSIRGNFTIAVINSIVYKIMPNLTYVVIGILETSVGEVFIDENLNQQICIVDGKNAYIYNWSLPPNLTVQSGSPIGAGVFEPNYVCFHDTYFLFGNAVQTGASTYWYVYGYDTPTTISYISDQTFQVKPDYPLAIKRIPGQSSNVIVFGTSVCEVHTHIGTTENYRRNSSVSIDYGCISVDTIAASDNYIAWLAVNESNAPVIMIFDGQKATPISSDGIDYLMGSLTRPDLSTALFFRQDGHLFYMLTFYFLGRPNANPPEEADNLTLIYDFNTQKFYHASDQYLNYHPARQVVYFKNDLYFISLNNGSFYRWDTDITQIIEDVVPTFEAPEDAPLDPNLIYDMQRIRICQTIRAPKTTPFVVESVFITIDQGNDAGLVYDCLVLMITESTFPVYPDTRIYSESDSGYVQIVPEGAGTDDCPGVPYTAKIQLSISKDGGVTFSNYVDKQLNPLGYRKNILHWDRFGLCNEFTPKFRFWSSNRVLVTDGAIKLFVANKGK